MSDYLLGEAMLAQLARDRTAHMLGEARVAVAMENAGARSNGARSRKRRERVARLLKALAMWVAPPAAPETRRATPAQTTV